MMKIKMMLLKKLLKQKEKLLKQLLFAAQNNVSQLFSID